MGEQALLFDRFELYPGQRLLLDAGKPLRLGGRALDILIALASRPGEVVNKEDLISRVWPNTIVEETSLRVHIVALRKALGDDHTASRFIANVAGRGYCFVASITRTTAPVSPQAVAAEYPPPSAMPVSITRVIGRADVVAVIAERLESARLVTIVGPGGMGKTTVALAVAEAVATRHKDGIVFVDLAPLSDPLAVPAALASALGIMDRSETLLRDLISHLRGREILVVFDNCEHLIGAAAALVELILQQVPETRWLATSREPLRIAGEWVHRIGPLDFPPADVPLTAQQALGYPAVELFVERASACLGGYELGEGDAPLVAEICRRLDGIALAIELAAGQLDLMGVRDLAGSLDDCFQLLTRGRRTALPRHQTLRATLDWSYGILPQTEQLVLRRLSVFSSGFTLDAARKVVGDDGITPSSVLEAVANLVAKSLVSADIAGDVGRYRLLDTTLAYAREQLAQAGESDVLHHRHAQYFLKLFEQSEAEWETRPTPEWLDDYVRHLSNLRAALDWSFGPKGDPTVGVALTVAAVPFWLALLLVEECEARVQRSLTLRDHLSDRDRMRLYAALGWPKMRAVAGLGNGGDAWRMTLEIAQAIGDVDYQMRSLWALWVERSNAGQPREALELADCFSTMAKSAREAADVFVGERMRARSLLFLGRLGEARSHIDHMLAHYRTPLNRSHVVRFQYEQRATARITLARLLWLQGAPDAAMNEAEAALHDALASNHSLTAAHVLSDAACAIALLVGDIPAAERYTAMLKELTSTQSLDVWNTYGDCFQAEILIQQGQGAAGLELLDNAMRQLEMTGYVLLQSAFLSVYAQGLLATGQVERAEATLELALARCETSDEGWYVPELHRQRGEILRSRGQLEDAAECFETALRIAARQGALGWELRAANSLARLEEEHDRGHEARARLAAISARIVGGRTSADLRKAHRLLGVI